ncbi:LAMP1 [Branchiostoma lanceolatum]|uniref:LAMP1 protein n=1 Tax=Branchiostoma lanceolatum TaxID=7740 RepID=A0A8K0EAU9_BRALA|nr:LAMP1 [Branchiostoma lanceolatum]
MCPKMLLIPTILAVLFASSVRASVGLTADEPAPPEGHFVLTKKPLIGKPEPCLLLNIAAMFNVGYTKTDNTTAIVSFALPTNSTVTGDCSHLTDERHAHLNLAFGDAEDLGLDGTFGLELTFERNVIFTHFSLSGATLYYKLVPDMFPDAKDANTTASATISNEQYFYTSSNAFSPHSYRCHKPQTLEFTFSKPDRPKSSLTMHSVQVQPFYVPSSGKFSPPETCPDDITTTPGPVPHTTPITPLIPVGHFALNDTKGNACFLLSVGAEFHVEYELKDNTTRNATYVLPRNSTVGGACSDSKATMALSFFKGFNLTVTFKTKGSNSFELVSASVGYVRDPKHFPNATSPGAAVNEVQQESMFETDLGKSYLCKSLQYFDVGSTVRLTVSELQVQPFAVKSMNFSEASECAQDLPSTMMPIQNATTIPAFNTTAATMSPIGNVTTILPSNDTTVVPIRNATTVQPSNTTSTMVPIENATTIITTPKPTGPPKEPPQGHFEVKDTKGNVCLLANMSVQFKVNYTKTDKKIHTATFDLPKTAKATGFCTSDNSSLTLNFHDGAFSVTFDFLKDKDVKGKTVGRFNMSTIVISYTELPSIFAGTKSPDARRQVSNNTMSMFSANGDKSYKCTADVDITVTKDVSIVVSHVQLQPFGVKSGKFSSAEDCSEDSGSNTVPVIIGVVVAVVVVVVFVAYIVVSKRKAKPQKFTSLN